MADVERIEIEIVRLPHGHDLALPDYATAAAAGADLLAAIGRDIELAPMDRRIVPTGTTVALSRGSGRRVRTASGAMVPLGGLIRVVPTTTAASINHYNLFRSTEISGSPPEGVRSGAPRPAVGGVAEKTLPRGAACAGRGACGGRVGGGHPHRCRLGGHDTQGGHHDVAGQIHHYPEPDEHGWAVAVESGRDQARGERLALEVDRCERQRIGDIDAGFGQPLFESGNVDWRHRAARHPHDELDARQQ